MTAVNLRLACDPVSKLIKQIKINHMPRLISKAKRKADLKLRARLLPFIISLLRSRLLKCHATLLEALRDQLGHNRRAAVC